MKIVRSAHLETRPRDGAGKDQVTGGTQLMSCGAAMSKVIPF